MNTKRLVLIIAILASFVAFLDSSVTSVALPQISKQLGGGLATQQWVNNAYLITLGSCILAAGSLSDIFGRKKILVIGLVGFLMASLLCAAAATGFQLSIARGLQGIAGALLVPSSLAIIISTFSGNEQARAIGQWTAWTGIAFIIGPLVGGIMVDSLSWRFVFILNVIPIAVALLLLARLDFEDEKHERARVDLLGTVLGATGLAGIVYALIEQEKYGWQSPLIFGTLLAGVVLLSIFIMHEKRTDQPMLPLELFESRNFSAGNIATFFIYAALSLQGFLLVIFLQQVADFPATFAGLASVLVTICMFFLSSRVGALAGRYGPRLFMTLGPILAGIGTLSMIRVGIPTQYWTELLPGILLFGMGVSITVAPLTSAILGSIKSSQAGIGSAVNNAVARIAGLLAVAVIGMVIGKSMSLEGFHSGIIFCSLLLIAGGITSAIGIVNPTSEQ